MTSSECSEMLDVEQDDQALGELMAMTAFTNQAHVCLSQMIRRTQAELEDQFDGFELALTHCGDRIDVQVFTPANERQRAIVERALLLPVEYSPENGLVMIGSGFPAVQVGSIAQVVARHKSQLAVITGWRSDSAAHPNTPAEAVRFLFSTLLADNYPHWLEHASAECPVSASFRVASDGSSVALMCYPPQEPVDGDSSECPTFH